jgi:pimeloyl-ACP methyl ester carboxylesterase
MPGETLLGATGRLAPADVRGVVMVLHGGQSVSTTPTTATQLSVVRMIPLARAIRRGLRGTGAVVWRPRLQVRGWNGAAASPVADLTALLDQIPDVIGSVPVVLVGHSMGGRAVMRAAGHPLVTAVAGLAPWLPPGEPTAQLAGRQVLLVHGDADHTTSPAETWAFAEQASAVTATATIEIHGGEHSLLRRVSLWHKIAADFARLSLAGPGAAQPAGGSEVSTAFERARAGLPRAAL